ncbi:intermembrane lipid transfer protein VPS13B-like isoform X2 [Babylonia areolata]
MFKLESYVTPWLLGYLDQYVKLRPEDLQLSLWGGDAVLYNLDLRLDMVQKMMHLPIVFKSGHIHELRLHVPWTKLGSEPMVITINTVECIVKVKDFSDVSSSASSSSASRATSASSRRRKLKRQMTEDNLPPGYLQSILNRVVNNVTFIVNNMILKFVEDDIVLSVNVKSAECYSCDGSWNRAFVDITPEDLALRRMVHFSDLTVCLDKTNADGHIENYQEPMLYRCFLSCRLHMTYDSVHAKLPIQTKLNVMCDKLDGLISDTQLPMFLRLVELCLALYYGYLDVAPSQHHEGESTKTSPAQDPSAPLADEGEREEEEDEQGEGDQGWAAWMWSMVPQILPEEDEDDEGYHRNKLVDKPAVLSLGFYIQQASLTFKVTEVQREKGRGSRGHKSTFHPFLVLEAGGIGVEILMQGLTFFSVQCGIRHFSLASAWTLHLWPCRRHLSAGGSDHTLRPSGQQRGGWGGAGVRLGFAVRSWLRSEPGAGGELCG